MPMPNRNIQDANAYRYAYQGQEKDPETGKEAFQLRLWDGRIGRWLTTDPAGQYSSPYLGMGNNPIITIDINGGVIYVVKDGVNYQYKNGNLIDKHGNTYAGNDDFLLKTQEALGKLDYATSSILINNGKLEKSGLLHEIATSKDVYSIVYERGKHYTHGRIRIDPKATVKTPTEGGVIKSPYEITLAHELGHLYSVYKGQKNRNEWFTLEGHTASFDENFASHFENIFRSALKLPLRTHYGTFDGSPYGPSKLFWPRGLFLNKRTFPIEVGKLKEIGIEN